MNFKLGRTACRATSHGNKGNDFFNDDFREFIQALIEMKPNMDIWAGNRVTRWEIE